MTTFYIYRDKKKPKLGEWRWRAKRKGRIVADSGEGYKREVSALKAIKSLVKDLADADFKVFQGGVNITP